MRTNPFGALYEICNTGSNAWKYAGLAPSPRMIDIEPTDACNFRCLMCPTGNRSLSRKAGVMDWGVFVRVAEQCAGYGTGLRFIGWGEPMLCPELVAMVEYATALGLPTHINTNGSLMDAAMASRLIEGGLSSIKFSLQGTDRDGYAEMRNVDWFDGLRETVAMFHTMRGDRSLPYIQVSTTTTRETPDQVEAFRAMFDPICDAVSVGKTVFAHLDLTAARMSDADRATLAKLSEYHPADLTHPMPCPEVYDKLTVHWDGAVRVCCNDYDGITDLGNVMKRPLFDIWRDVTIELLRKRLADNDYGGPLCATCWHYMPGAVAP